MRSFHPLLFLLFASLSNAKSVGLDLDEKLFLVTGDPIRGLGYLSQSFFNKKFPKMEGLYAELGELEFHHRKRMREMRDENNEIKRKIQEVEQKRGDAMYEVSSSHSKILPTPIYPGEVPKIRTPLNEAHAALDKFYASVEKLEKCSAEKGELTKQNLDILNEQNRLIAIYEKERDRLTKLLDERTN